MMAEYRPFLVYLSLSCLRNWTIRSAEFYRIARGRAAIKTVADLAENSRELAAISSLS